MSGQRTKNLQKSKPNSFFFKTDSNKHHKYQNDPKNQNETTGKSQSFTKPKRKKNNPHQTQNAELKPIQRKPTSCPRKGRQDRTPYLHSASTGVQLQTIGFIPPVHYGPTRRPPMCPPPEIGRKPCPPDGLPRSRPPTNPYSQRGIPIHLLVTKSTQISHSWSMAQNEMALHQPDTNTSTQRQNQTFQTGKKPKNGQGSQTPHPKVQSGFMPISKNVRHPHKDPNIE